MTGDLSDRERQAIPVAVVIHALRLLAPFDRKALRGFSRALFYANAHDPVGFNGKRPSPREEPATAVLPAVLTESRDGFRVEVEGAVVATHALPNNLIIAAVWMAWVEADSFHGGLPEPSDHVLGLLCAAVASHSGGRSLRRPHSKWPKRLGDPRWNQLLPTISTGTDSQKGRWLFWCQRAAAVLGWREATTVGGYEKAVRQLVRIRTK